MKAFIFAILALSALQFSLGDDWEGMEDAITVQEDAALEIVDSLDIRSEIPFTQQIENQVQQLIKEPDLQSEQQEGVQKEEEEIHSVEYWLERLGNEYSDETILLQTPSITDQITSVIGNLILQGGDQGVLKEISEIQKKESIQEEPLIISGIELEFSQVQLQSTQLQELLDSAKEMQRNIAETDQKHNHKNPIIDIDFNDIMSQEEDQEESINVNDSMESQDNNNYQINDNNVQTNDNQSQNDQSNDQNDQSNDQPINLHKNIFQPNEELINQQTENKLYNFLTGKQDEEVTNNHKTEDDGYKFYSFNSNKDEQRPFYDDKESALKFYEQELPKDPPTKVESEASQVRPQKQENEKQNTSANDKQEVSEPSSLRKYLLYTEQPDVIVTGSTDTEIKKDKELVSAFKSMDTDQHWIPAKQSDQNEDLKYELFKSQKPKEAEKQQTIEVKQENQKQQVDNPHKFISFKAEPSVDIPKEIETPKSKYEQLPETKLQTKEEMKREKEQRIKEMQSQIAEQLKNKKLQKKADSDEHVLGYEKEYIEWEMATQPKTFQAEINFVMTSNNLRKKRNV